MTVERIIYFGTPDFAVPPLEALVESGRRPLLVVTQPARSQGRGLALVASPVAKSAEDLGLDLVEAPSVKDEGFLSTLEELQPDLAVVVAFGQIFRRRLLRLPVLGCLNLHASLLPRHRGAAPIQAAIAAGDTRTGVATMWMERGLDTGPVLRRAELEIGDAETAPELSQRLARLGGQVLVETIEDLSRDWVPGTPQQDALATYAPQLKKEDGEVDWSLTAKQLYDRWRAYQPWPGLAVQYGNEIIKLDVVRTTDGRTPGPGVVAGISDRALLVGCGEGVLAIEAARRPGRKPVSGRDLANGLRLEVGAVIGDPEAQQPEAQQPKSKQPQSQQRGESQG